MEAHHIFVKPGVKKLINFQRDGNLAKPYQVRQIRAITGSYGFVVEDKD